MAEKLKSILERIMPWGENIPPEDFKFGIALIKDLGAGNITMDEFNRHCTYLMLRSGFDQLCPVELPDMPDAVANYDSLPLDKRRKTKDDFWQNWEVKKYMEDKYRAISQTLTDKHWLEDNLHRLEEYGDQTNVIKVKYRLEAYQEWENRYWEEIKDFFQA